MSDMEEDEDYGFEYETDDDEEQDVDVENQVRHAGFAYLRKEWLDQRGLFFSVMIHTRNLLLPWAF